jgi:hypothetical protein
MRGAIPHWRDSPRALAFTRAVIPRLRCDLGINLAGIADILEMIERLRAVQCENDLLRSRL